MFQMVDDKKTYGSRAFSVSAPELWNNLPNNIRSCDNKRKRKPKTYLLKNYYIFFTFILCIFSSFTLAKRLEQI